MGPKLQSPASGRIEEHFGFDRADLGAIREYVSDDTDDCQHTGTPQITLTVYPAG